MRYKYHQSNVEYIYIISRSFIESTRRAIYIALDYDSLDPGVHPLKHASSFPSR